MQNEKEIEEDIKMALKYEEDLKKSGYIQPELNSALLKINRESSMMLDMPQLSKAQTFKQDSVSTHGKESNPNSAYLRKEDEELK